MASLSALHQLAIMLSQLCIDVKPLHNCAGASGHHTGTGSRQHSLLPGEHTVRLSCRARPAAHLTRIHAGAPEVLMIMPLRAGRHTHQQSNAFAHLSIPSLALPLYLHAVMHACSMNVNMQKPAMVLRIPLLPPCTYGWCKDL